MKWFYTLSIRNKLIVIILAVGLSVVSIVGIFRIAWDIHQVKNTLTQELSALAQLIGDRSSAALAFDEVGLAQENLDSLQVIPHVVKSCLYHSDGRILARYRRDVQDVEPCPPLAEIRSIDQSIHHGALHIVDNVREGAFDLGWIYIVSDLSPVHRRKHEGVIFGMFGLLSAALITALLAHWVQRLISSPIVKITEVARSIEEHGDHSLRARVSGDDEVGQLARTFNDMLDALETQNEQLRRSQKMDALGKLTGGIAHDYNNMLGVILGYAELLQTMLADQPKLARYAQEIHHAGERGARLTSRLLAFSRQKTSDAGMLNINELLRNEQHLLEKTLTARIKLVYRLQPGLWPVWLDEGDLEDAILNMSINAMHAIDADGVLSVETFNESIDAGRAQELALEARDYVVIRVCDTGCGMDEETLSKIFDPFFSTKGDHGTGLGLSQVYGFVESSGGAIRVGSTPEEGTCFTLYFPRYIPEMLPELLDEKEQLINLRGTESILLVDDEQSLRDLSAEILKAHGYRVECADSAANALLLLEQHPFDLLITDVIMPDMDGYRLAARVQQQYPGMKIQLVSGFTDAYHVDMMNDALHRQLIYKPFPTNTLLRRIRELLDS